MILSSFRRLVNIELRLFVKRRETWAIVLTYAVVLAVNLHPLFTYLNVRSDDGSWTWTRLLTETLREVAVISLFLSSALTVLLIGSEFSWGTARQSIVDGMSRLDWVGTKVSLLLFPALVFWIITTGSVSAVSLTLGLSFRPLSAIDVQAMTGLLLALIGWGFLAQFFTVIVRQAAVALVLWLLYVAVLEGEVLGWLLALGMDEKVASGLLPASFFLSLSAPGDWVSVDGLHGLCMPVLLSLFHYTALFVLSWASMIWRDL